MSSKSQKKLKEASKLVNQDKAEEALKIVRPIVEEEPDNALAWWVLAYAVDDPSEARKALHRVLEIDPLFEHADQARTMLETLDAQYPAEAQEDELTFFPDPFTAEADDPFSSGFPGETEPFQSASDAIFIEEDEAFPPEFLQESDIESSEEPAFVSSIKTQAPDLTDMAFMSEDLTDEDLAHLEEQAGRRRRGGRRRRLLLAAFLVLLFAVIAVGLIVGLSDSGSQGNDPGRLQVVEAGSEQIAGRAAAAGLALQDANLGSERQIVIAESGLGKTLYVEVCSTPGPDLPSTILKGMEIAAAQAPGLADELGAVGVSVDNCNAGQRDSLYRAVVSLADAQQYLDGKLGTGEQGLANFQALWNTP